MNKNELVSAVAQKAGLTKADAKKAIDATTEGCSYRFWHILCCRERRAHGCESCNKGANHDPCKEVC